MAATLTVERGALKAENFLARAETHAQSPRQFFAS